MKHFVRLAAAASIWTASLLSLPTAALAECDGPIPDFRDVVPTAARVFIGDVTSVDDPDVSGFASRFIVRVRYVLRGRVHHWPLRISNVHGSPCAPVIRASKGQRIALALDGKRPRPYPTNSIAYISGEAPSDWIGSDPHLGADEVYRLAGVPYPTDDVAAPNTATAADAATTSKSSSPVWLAVFTLALAISIAMWPTSDRRRARQDPSGS